MGMISGRSVMFMNPIERAIRERRSIRAYKAEPIAEEDLKAIAMAGIWAPNAMNEQLWHFTVVSDASVIERMNQANIAGTEQSGIEFLQNKVKQPEYHAFHHAPAVIIISAQEGKFTAFDCGAAAENIALAAFEKNIGSCMIASAEFMFAGDPEIRQVLKIPENHQFVCAISLGYYDQSPKNSERTESVIDYIL